MVETRASKRAREEPSSTSFQAVTERLAAFMAEAGPGRQVAPRCAAVLVPLFASLSPSGSQVRVVLTQRSSNLNTHRGEVCLPGGKRDPGDVDDVATALREANEELGIAPSDVHVLGTLAPLLSKHYLSVTPVLALVPQTRAAHAPNPNRDEVADVFDVPLSLFLKADRHSSRDIRWEGLTYRIHSFEHDGHTIWGLTAGILIKVARIAYGRSPDFQETAPRGVDYTRLWHDGSRLQVHTAAGGQDGSSDQQAAGSAVQGAGSPKP